MGFLGYNLAEFFKQNNCIIYGIGHCNTPTPSTNKIFEIWKNASISLSELQKMNIQHLDYVFHCGGSGLVGESFLDPAYDFYKTVEGTRQICEYLRLYHPNAHLIYPSSVAVIGSSDSKKIDEKTIGTPISPYGYHKKIAEEICQEYSQFFNIKTSIIRLFSVYGIGLKKQFLWDCVQKIRQNINNDEIYLFGTGEEIRDYIHIQDVIQIFQKIIENQVGIFEIYNGGSGEGQKIKKIATHIANLLDFHGKIVFEKSNHRGDPQCYLADIQKTSELLHFKTRSIFIEQLDRYVSWAKKQ